LKIEGGRKCAIDGGAQSPMLVNTSVEMRVIAFLGRFIVVKVYMNHQLGRRFCLILNNGGRNMSHLDQIRKWGYEASLSKKKFLFVENWKMCSPDHQRYILINKKEIIEELKSKSETGVGSMLKKIIEKSIPKNMLDKIPPESCGCADYEVKMNIWGVDECLRREKEIVEYLVKKSDMLGYGISYMPRKIKSAMASKMFYLAVKKQRKIEDANNK